MDNLKITHILKLLACTSFALFVVNCALLVHQRQVVNKLVSKKMYLHESERCLLESIINTDRDPWSEEDNPDLERLPVDFEQVAMTVEPNDRFSLIDDRAWADTLAPKRGFVRLGPNGRSFAIGNFHQLHCVNALRFSYTVARDGLVTDPEILREKIGHDNHCFQFIRQTIQCNADNSLVPLHTNRNMSLAAMGFGNTHRCRNWKQLREFVIENIASWKGKPFYNGTSGQFVG